MKTALQRALRHQEAEDEEGGGQDRQEGQAGDAAEPQEVWRGRGVRQV